MATHSKTLAPWQESYDKPNQCIKKAETSLHVQGKEQQLHFAGAAMKRYPMSKARDTQVRWYALSEGIRGQTD